MIHVVAEIRLHPGQLPDYLAILQENIPAVLAEPGCLDYRATVDFDAGLPTQSRQADTVSLLEKWASPEALHAHRQAPHMLTYREKTRGLVESVQMKVLQEV
ncbi:MAG: antibiotic biosynthesis monooxygenase [Desulfuromonadales bacterium]|nr:antibiotic biosynthesis monooxygenase [Desulfuromonadales bacterium]